MEHCNGGDLAQFISKHAPLVGKELTVLFGQIAGVMDYLQVCSHHHSFLTLMSLMYW